MMCGGKYELFVLIAVQRYLGVEVGDLCVGDALWNKRQRYGQTRNQVTLKMLQPANHEL